MVQLAKRGRELSTLMQLCQQGHAAGSIAAEREAVQVTVAPEIWIGFGKACS